MDGRFNVSFDDVRAVAYAALRHRLILSFEGEAEGIDPDRIIEDLLTRIPIQPGKLACYRKALRRGRRRSRARKLGGICPSHDQPED